MALLLLSAEEVMAKRARPYPGTAPWHNENPNFVKPDHDVDYPVPDFGKDHDIIDTQKHIADQEKKHGKWTPKKDEKTGEWNVPQPIDNDSYQYRNLQLDNLIALNSDPICSSAGCTQYKHPKKKTHPMNYPVPNFGGDSDIADTFNSLKVAEAQRQHHWDFHFQKPPPVNPAKKTLYDFAPELEGDIKASKKHLSDAEARYGRWDFADLQLESDPICGSTGCPKVIHHGPREAERKAEEVEYQNPDSMELDSDIQDTHAHLKKTEKLLGKWKLGEFSDPYGMARTGSRGFVRR